MVMTTVKDVNPSDFVSTLKEELKSHASVKAPSWADYVKTGVGKQRPPEQEDWWFIRSAAILRKVYLLGPIGTSRLRKKFSTPKNNGHRPTHTSKASGSIIRTALKQLEEAELIKKEGKSGRIMTPKGQKLLDGVAHKMKSE